MPKVCVGPNRRLSIWTLWGRRSKLGYSKQWHRWLMHNRGFKSVSVSGKAGAGELRTNWRTNSRPLGD